MLKTKKCKLLLVCACIIALILPYATPALAVTKATYKQSDLTGATMNLVNLPNFPHNSSYTIKDSDGSKHIVYNVCVKKDESSPYDRTNAIYCLNGEKTFPGFDKDGNSVLTLYKNFGDFFNGSDEDSEVYKYVYDSNEGIKEENYNSICWLINNFYLEYQDDDEHSQYDVFLNNIFSDYLTENNKLEDKQGRDTIDDIKGLVDFDDINSLQQCAIWYFSNNGFLTVTENEDVDVSIYTSGYDYTEAQSGLDEIITRYNMPSMEIRKLNTSTMTTQEEQLSPERISVLNMIYSYLITNAKKATTSNNISIISYPEFQETTPIAEIDGTDYKIGPFTISDTTADEKSYEITLTDGDKDLTEYTLKTSEGTEIKTLKETIGKTFYIYVPTTQNISKIRIGIKYLQSLTNASFWEKVDDKGIVDYTFQPLVWITKDNKEAQYKEVPIEKSDLALRKYIVSVDGDDSIARTPVVDATGLLNGEKDAKYKHKKSPVEIYSGNKIVYEIRVYNEGKTSATVKQITDFIPDGLELVSKDESEINSTYNWNVVNGIATIDIEKTLDAIDEESIKSKKDTITGGLDTTYVQIELKVKENLTAESVLTNVAEITDDNINDNDSHTSSIKKENINQSTFSGNSDNKTDLDDQNYHYKGLEDDDDFEKVIVKVEGKKVFDLALQKFVTKVNGKAENREPKVDVSSLKTTTNATYTTTKTPLVVEQGDIITYKIRVYNEGELDAYAEKVADYIPEGLGFIVNHKTNIDNYWDITSAVKAGAKTVKLSSINNALNNVKLSDFENTTSLDDVEIVKGLAKLESTALSSNVSKSNLIKKFDIEKDKNLDYKDIEIVCVVLADEVKDNNLKNIAEITDDSTPDDEGNPTPVEDRDSTPDSVKPNDYPGKDEKQDDNDYEDLTMEIHEYDLALQKFITAVDGNEVKDRIPVLTNENGTIRYSHSSEALPLGNGDIVEYTIRVYNEGPSSAYASKVSDDLPKGLKYLPDNETNKKYGWEFVDKYGQKTNDINQAVTVVTNYLSKEESEKRGENCLLKPFDSSKPISTDSNNPNPDFRDVKLVFEVDESVLEKTKTTEKRTIINTAEITEETDDKGRPVIDRDSTPNNWKDGEDDIDREKIYVKYFDLSLKKDLVKVLVIENGNTTEYNVSEDQLFKVEINKKKLNSTVVKFVYNITVKNEGEIAGYAKEVKDYIPDGLEFISDDNTGWYKLSNNVVATDALANTLLNPDQTASVQITLKWINGENNLGKKTNVAEISKDENEYNSPDIDSTPDNQVPGEDDIDNAPVILSISTGSNPTYYKLVATVAIIMVTGIVLIKKYVL